MKLLFILALILLLTSSAFAETKCSKDNAATEKLFEHLTQPLLDNTANKTELDYRAEWQAKLELLDDIVDKKDDTLIVAYFAAREDSEFGDWVIAQGGYKWLAPRILCFSRHFRETAKHLFKTHDNSWCACTSEVL